MLHDLLLTEGSERTGEKRVGAPSGAKSARTSVEARMMVRGNDGDERRWWRVAFCRGEVKGTGRTDPVNQGSRGQNGTRCPPPPTLTVTGCRSADMRDIGASRVPLPGFLCASADRPKRVYGTSPHSPRKAIPTRSFIGKIALSLHLATNNAAYTWTGEILMRRNEMTRYG